MNVWFFNRHSAPRLGNPSRQAYKTLSLPRVWLAFSTSQKTAILNCENDNTDQIHDETARQSRSAFGIGLSIARLSSDSNLRRLRQKVGAF
jgi:hypothetical protein